MADQRLQEAERDVPREWRVVVRRPGVEGQGVTYRGPYESEARRFYASDTREYAKDEPSATVVLQSRIVQPWIDEEGVT